MRWLGCCTSKPRVLSHSPEPANRLQLRKACPTLLSAKSLADEKTSSTDDKIDCECELVVERRISAASVLLSTTAIALVDDSDKAAEDPRQESGGAQTPSTCSWILSEHVESTASGDSDEALKAVDPAALFAGPPDQVPAIGGCVNISQPHSKHVLPPEVVLFEPSQSEIFAEGTASASHRQIFLNTELLPEEQEALRQLHAALEKQGHAGGQFPTFMRPHALRMLQHCRFDVKKALGVMQTHLSERVTRLPVSEADVLRDLHSSFMYWHGRDHKCRPCLVVRLERVGEMLRDKERLFRLVMFVLEYAIRFALAPGRVENWGVIMDLRNALSIASPLQIANVVATAATLSPTLENIYTGRMVWMRIVNMPGGAFIRNTINSVIPAEQKKKVSFVADPAKELAALFEPNQLERRYGGSAPDLEAGETYPFHFAPDCCGSAAAAEGIGTEHSSLHTFSGRAFHEGQLWDESLPEAHVEWLRQARTSSLSTMSAQAASRSLEEQGEAPIAPCRGLAHWFKLVS